MNRQNCFRFLECWIAFEKNVKVDDIQARSPLIRRASWISLGIIVTRLA